MSSALKVRSGGDDKPCKAARARRWVGPALGAAGLCLLAAGLQDAWGQDPAPAQPAKASPAQWTVLFRADDPALWNTNTKGKAIPLQFAPEEFRYVRLRRMDTGEALIVRLCPEQLSGGNQPNPDAKFWWNGTGKDEHKARHLGIVEGPRHKFPGPRGMITIAFQGWDGWTGSGFGHKYGFNDAQHYGWRGKAIPRTVFEIAVSDGPLSEDEKRSLLSSPR